MVLAATRAYVESVKLNTLCTTRQLTIDLTRSRPVRPRTEGRLEKIEDSTAENGRQLEKIEDMLGHLQNVLDDIQANQDADEPNSDQGQHNGAASTRGSMSDKLWLKERTTAWKTPNLRAFWILCGEKPKGCELSRIQLQGVFKNTALASFAVVEQVNPLAEHDVTAFMPRGAERGTAGTIDIKNQFAILAKVLLLVIRRDTTSVGGKAWWSYARQFRTVSTW